MTSAWSQPDASNASSSVSVTDVVGNAVPHAAGAAGAVFKTGLTNVPPVEHRARDAQLVQGPPDLQMGLLHQPDDLQLLGCGIPHSSSPPSAIMLF